MVHQLLKNFVLQVFNFTLTFFVPLQEQWSKTLFLVIFCEKKEQLSAFAKKNLFARKLQITLNYDKYTRKGINLITYESPRNT